MKGRRERDQAVTVAGSGWGGGWEDLSHMERLCQRIWDQNLTVTMIYIPSHFTSLSTDEGDTTHFECYKD